MKQIIRKITPNFILKGYHYFLARLADFVYGHPSGKLFVIGVTGTKGKTTTSNFICEILNESGRKCAMATTANFRIGDKEWLNRYKQTMLGRFKTHKFLKRAIKEGCTYAVIETSSEGILQYRHIGIDYNLGVFTGLTPEHLEAHGSFENYKNTKKKLFEKVSQLENGAIVVNGDSKYKDEFLDFDVSKKMTFGIENQVDIKGVDLIFEKEKTRFISRGVAFEINLLGRFNVINALSAIACADVLDISLQKSASILKNYFPKIGRMEFIKEGQDFSVIVDYAHEPNGYEEVYRLLNSVKMGGRVIGVLGSAGGGRDRARRKVLGSLASKYLDLAVVTNEDPYDEDPEKIIEEVLEGAKSGGMEEGKNLFKAIDRKEGIEKALNKAKMGDIVIITGKGCEQYIMGKDFEKIPWDDRRVVRELLRKK